jgi:hypothetical protein
MKVVLQLKIAYTNCLSLFFTAGQEQRLLNCSEFAMIRILFDILNASTFLHWFVAFCLF